ncbi:MAG: hypothetical protein H7Y09_09155 [Chitinophagaceae bacterium]|nr:hypothetical protein [Anaerolineae bacterium]
MGFVDSMQGRRTTSKGCLIVGLGMLLGTLACISVIYFAVDNSCVSSANTWLPDYAGSQLVSEEHSWLRPFGIGETTRILYTTNAFDTVSRWYTRQDILNESQGKSRDGQIAQLRWATGRDQNTDGTVIALVSRCAPELALGGS